MSLYSFLKNVTMTYLISLLKKTFKPFSNKSKFIFAIIKFVKFLV